MLSSSSTLRGIALIVVSMAVFTANDAMMKQVAADLPPMQVIFMRGVSATLTMALVLIVTGMWRRIAQVADGIVTARSLVEVVSISSFIIALARAPIADVVAIAMTAPLILLPLAAVLLGERVGAVRWLLVGLGFAGALLVAQPGGAGFDPILFVAFICAIAQACRDLLSRRISPTIPTVIVVFSTVAVVCVVAGIATAAIGWRPPSAWHVGYMAAAGVLLAIGHLLLFVAFRSGPASVIAPFGYSATVWAIIAGILVFGDWPDATALVGIAVLTVTGVLLARGAR